MATYPAMVPAHPPVHHVVYTMPHVNQAWTALHEVPYERFHEGGPAVLVSNGTTASYVPPHHIIKTQAFQQALPVYASCPHFVQLGTCMLGASCGLVHPVQLRAPVLPAYGASFSAYTASLSLSPSVSPLLESYQQHPASMPPSLVYMPPSMEPQQLPFVEPLFAPTGTTIAVPRDQLAGSTLRRLAPAKAPKVRPLKFSGNRQRRGNKPLVIPPPAAGDTEPGPRQLIVNYLAPRVDTAGLRKLFEAFGELEDALVMTDRTGASRGFGFVVFKRCADAVTAIESASGRVLLGKRVRLGYLNPQYPVNEGKSLADVAMTLEPLLDDDSEDEYHSDHQQSASFLEDTQCSGASSYTTRRSSQSAVDLLDASDVADDPFRVKA